jgi:DNA-directed RNA polymerase subunit RPC12/RpoP
MPSLISRIRTRSCPLCGSEMVRNSAFTSYLDRFPGRLWLMLSLKRPYRCMDCDERFYALRFKKKLKKPLATEQEKRDLKTPLAS